MAAHARPLHPYYYLVLLLIMLLPLAAAAESSYETKSLDPGLVVMTLPEPVSGPESLAFDGRGGGPYSGVSDGRILRWQGRLRGWTDFAYNSKHKSVAICSPEKKLVVPESVCGRPLGLQFHRRSGDLYVADAYLGLLRVPARGGLAEVVAAEAGGVPFNFLNGLDVDQRTGDVYFTDSSTTFRRSDYQLVVALGDATGRLLRYDWRARRVAVLHGELSYPNGVAVSADGTHVVVAHTALCELRRYWVRGARAGTSEPFAELPGYPDNVRPDGSGGYWVALSGGGGGGDAAPPTVAVRVSREGNVTEALDGFSFVSVSEVAERGGALWLGDDCSSGEDEEAGEILSQFKVFKRKLKTGDVGSLDDFVLEKRNRKPTEFIEIEGEGDETPYEESYEDESVEEVGSDGELIKKRDCYRRFDATNPSCPFEIGMKFTGKREFKEAMVRYCLRERKVIKYLKDDDSRVRVKCDWAHCPWVCLCSKNSRTESWQVATLVDEHTCPQEETISMLQLRGLLKSMRNSYCQTLVETLCR
ncbi:hypothetical protein U9M48_014262 [Paspalum notatum var. saurae]|uniref:Strictosidine synthase conserved region domain-containing protein n=1 Tax=Paspalum notatum var. saurae TaxID=547442 RepID=A0AAQ3T1A6_PASNO